MSRALWRLGRLTLRLAPWVLVACGHTAASVVHREAPGLPVIARPPAELVWRIVDGLQLPGAIRDIGALSGGDAVLIAGTRAHLWRDGAGVSLACGGAQLAADNAMVQAEGDHFIILAGDEAAAEVLRSDDRGAHCQRVRLPTLFVRNAPRGTLHISMHGERAYVWSSSGALLRSRDYGATWERLASLAGVVDMAPSPDGGTLAAVLAGVPGGAGGALKALTPAGRGWTSVAGAGALERPITLQPREGGVTVATGVGTLTLDASLGLERRRIDPAARYGAHRPEIICAVGDGRFFGAARGLLLSVDAQRTDGFAALPAMAVVRALDASGDGVLWASDGRSLWRGRFDARFVAVHEHPLHGSEPEAFAARDGTLLVVGASTAAWRRPGDASWRQAELPRDQHPIRAAHVDESGALFVLGGATLSVADAGEFSALRPPLTPPFPGAQLWLATDHERWTIVGGAAFTSDDHGARWDLRHGSAFLPAMAGLGSFGGDAVGGVASLVAVAPGPAGGLLAVDAEREIWRSDDGTHFARVGALPAIGGRGMARHFDRAVLAWDGAQRMALLHRDQMSLSRDGGATFTTELLPFAARWATFVDGTLVASGGNSSLLPVRCRAQQSNALFVYALGWIPDPEACDHVGSLLAPDGDAVWVLGEGMTAHRASLRVLVRSLAGSDPI